MMTSYDTSLLRTRRLVSTVAEVIRRGGIPFVLGGSSEQCVCIAAGLMSVMGGGIGIVNINSQLDVRPSNVSAYVCVCCQHIFLNGLYLFFPSN